MVCPTIAARAGAAQRKRGFTLTEIAIVLGIIGLILGAIWTAAASVYANQRTAHGNTAILQITQGVRNLYASTSNTGYTSAVDMSADLIAAGATPSDLTNGSGATANMVGPFPNGHTAVYSTSDGLGFVVVMTGVPQSSCINLLTTVGGNTRDAGLFNADAVANTTYPSSSDADVTGTPLTTPVTPSMAAAAETGTGPDSGQGGCTNVTNKVRFGFTMK